LLEAKPLKNVLKWNDASEFGATIFV